MPRGQWTFLTNHGMVLAHLARNPRATTRQIAREAGVTERAIQKVILDLESDGYIIRSKLGRGNSYTIHSELPMLHPMERYHAVGSLLEALGSVRRGPGTAP